MNSTMRRKRVFVSGQLVEYWENPEVPFGWTREDFQAYVDRSDWVLLFNSLTVAVPRLDPELGS